MRIRRSKKTWVVALGVFVAVFLFTFLVQKSQNMNEDVSAASTAGFEAGYIISDYQMTNYNSMSEAQIQNFLSSKVSCNKDANYYNYLKSRYPQYNWHFANGHIVCLPEERFGDGEAIGAGQSAAHIIWQAAQDYKINPQVLIVLLQKESGLITDSFPNNINYRSATGYGCPDTAACSSKYYGFKNQVRNAAAMFRAVMNGGWTNYPVGNNYVQYSPNAACGGSVVNIRNKATSALYRYTPYQPNAATLAAGYGTATCGAYGNRNFYLYFLDWFGDIKNEGWPALSTVLSTNRLPNEVTDLDFEYRTHIEHYGWLNWVNGGAMSGTAGYGAQVEALSLRLKNGLSGIEYRTHVEYQGWGSYVKDGAVSGTTGQSKQIEAIQIRLTGDLAKLYDVYYRTHVQNIGWTSWVKNDAVSGTTGQGKQIEAIQVKIVKKWATNNTTYSAHVQDIGWMNLVKSPNTMGTTGQSKRIEAIKINLPPELASGNGISYRAHVQSIGWMNWVKNGEIAGTTGKALRMEAIQIKPSDKLAKQYDVYYRAHVQNIGWMDWVKNGEVAGTTGKALRVEALQVEVVKK